MLLTITRQSKNSIAPTPCLLGHHIYKHTHTFFFQLHISFFILFHTYINNTYDVDCNNHDEKFHTLKTSCHDLMAAYTQSMNDKRGEGNVVI